MKKYPHGLTLNAVCAAIDDYQRHEDSVPEEGILAAFNTLLGHSDIADELRIKQNHIRLRDTYIEELEQRAEAAEAKAKNLNDGWLNAIAERDEARTEQGKLEAARSVRDNWKERAWAAEEKLAELEKQASDQKPFMYGIMTANGDAHFEDFCVSSDPGLLEDVIWEWNNSLADNEPKSRVVALFTRPAPAVSLAELVPSETPPDEIMMLKSNSVDVSIKRGGVINGWNACRAAILRKIEEAK